MFEALPLVVDAPGDLGIIADAAERAARTWSLPAPQLVRVGSNGVFTCGEIVLRVGRATASMGSAIVLAERLTAAGVRVARPARHDWIDFESGLTATAWQRIDVVEGAPVDWQRAGAMVRSVHRIDPSTVEHPLPFCADFPWWNVDAMLPETDVLDDPTRRALLSSLDRHRWWIDSTRRGPMTLNHGDVHPGNVLVDANGPVLIDWDLLCVGPPEWDHSALRRWTSRWGGEPGMYEAFRSGYVGADAPDDPLDDSLDDSVLEAIAEMRLVIAMLMRLRRARIDPGQQAEVEGRLAYFRGVADPPMWRAQ